MKNPMVKPHQSRAAVPHQTLARGIRCESHLTLITFLTCSTLWLTRSLAQTSSATLIWDANTETNLAGYKMYYGPSSGNYTNVTDIGSVTTNTVPGLLTGITYYFAVTAYNTSALESGFSNEVSYTPTNSVNAPPTLDVVSNQTVNENAAPQTVALTGITSGATNEIQTLAITAVSDNPGLIPNPAVTYTSPNSTGTLSFAPVANSFGTANITVTVTDGGATNNLTSRTFAITVNWVNQPPTLDPINSLTVIENSGPQNVSLTGITSGAANENQTLTVTATSSNPALIPAPNIAYTSPNSTGSLTFAPATNLTGSAIITVNVNDGGATNNLLSRTFTVTVTAPNQPPVISAIANQTVQKNQSTPPLPFTISDSQTAASNLVLTATSSNLSLVPISQVVFGGSGPNRTVTVTPANGRNGKSLITVIVSDGTLAASASFLLTVTGNGQTAITSISVAQSSEAFIFQPAAILVTLQWTSTLGLTYHVLYKNDLSTPGWTDLSGPILGLDGTTSWIDATADGSPSRFYCVMAGQ